MIKTILGWLGRGETAPVAVGDEPRCTGVGHNDLPVLLSMERQLERPWAEEDLKAHMGVYRSWAGRILWRGKEPVAYVLYEQVPKATSLTRLAVVPGARGCGYALQLLEHVRNIAIGWGRAGCQCLVPGNDLAAQQFYRHIGWRCIYTLEGFFEDGADCLVFYSPLHREKKKGESDGDDRWVAVPGMQGDHLGAAAGQLQDEFRDHGS